MGFFAIFLRRLLLLLLITAAGGIAWSWRRDRAAGDAHGPPEWPPLTPDTTTPDTTITDATITDTPTTDTTTIDTPIADASSAASFVNALVDAPEARSRDGELGGWTDPLEDGSCPLSHPIKANDNSGIFHVPDGRFYGRTNPERCYSDAAAATADGYRQAKH